MILRSGERFCSFLSLDDALPAYWELAQGTGNKFQLARVRE